MQSKASKNRYGRNANAAEKRFQGWVKCRPCCWCHAETGSIVDHVVGAKYGFNKVHIGHFFVLPNCQHCDNKKTIDGKKLGDYSGKWYELHCEYILEGNNSVPGEVFDAITAWGRTWKNGKA